LTFWDIEVLLNILKKTITNSEAKNFFGQYTNKIFKEWDDILKSYQHDNIFLAEAASILIQNVVYEMYSHLLVDLSHFILFASLWILLALSIVLQNRGFV
jgi:hypothetical protein